MTNPDLYKLFKAELYEMNWFENTLIKTLGQLGRSVNITDLGTTIKKERANSQEHVNRIKAIFNSLGEPLESLQSKALLGLIADLTAASSLAAKNNTDFDLFLIVAIIKAANYKLGAYSAILELANAMQYRHIEGLLTDTIRDEKQTTFDLTQLLSDSITAAEITV